MTLHVTRRSLFWPFVCIFYLVHAGGHWRWIPQFLWYVSRHIEHSYPSTGLIFLSWRMLYSSLPRVPVGMRQVWWGMCSTEVGSEQSWATNWSHITLDKARGISRYQTMCELDSIRYGTDTPSVDMSRVCLVLWQSWHWLWKTLRIFLDF